MISTISWVGRGVAKHTPIKFVDTEEKEYDTQAPEGAEEKMDEESSSDLSEEDPNATLDSRYKLDGYDEEGLQFTKKRVTLL